MAKHRYAHIDSLRGIAAWAVLLFHTTEIVSGSGHLIVTGGTLLHTLIFEYLSLGIMGVILFFCISGFVIPNSFRSRDDIKAELKRFAVRRFFRLYPAFWVSIPLGFLMVHWVWGKDFPFSDVALNFTMMPEVLGAQPVMGLYWTLFVELLFYGL